MDVLVSEFHKNAVEKIGVRLRSDRGNHLIDFRIYSHEDVGEWPTPKTGITLTIEQQPELPDSGDVGEGDASRVLMVVDMPCTGCGNALLWWRSRMGARVCMICYPDPLEALRWLRGKVLKPHRR
jgi:Transcriptional Coactivator p15 (PC4)